MEPQGMELAEARKKRKLVAVSGVFFGLLLVLTLFSNTLQAITLPKVRTETPVKGKLVHSIEASGTLKPVEEAELKNETGWKVKAVHVKAGDAVVKDQPLITYDSKPAERQIADEQTALKQQKLQLEGLFESFVEVNRNGESTAIGKAKRDIESRQLDIDVRERKIQALQEDLAAQRQIVAPFDGIVTSVRATEGLPSTPGQSVVRVSNASRGYGMSVPVAADLAALLSVGEKIEVEVKDQTVQVMEGRIVEIADTQMELAGGAGEKQDAPPVMKTIRIAVQGEGLKGGERAAVRLLKSVSADEQLLISNEAIHKDREGKFVYVIEERKGPLGNGFYVRKSYIRTADANTNQSAVREGIFPTDQVIVESSEPLQAGNRVRLQ
ncbi:efflux RND transporter periplasmic adaptor subunit [Paenibacillus ehimensis]|uniref:efflux RND transporter periplasmic adaptor subunit n=1 Tax=Paenibacillus ehimensis TaxID=79264 RepID=UPI0004704C54|nr:efflux RND transporter periplasmic adaptor subunit [Paenibacillus ehimensis]